MIAQVYPAEDRVVVGSVTRTFDLARLRAMNLGPLEIDTRARTVTFLLTGETRSRLQLRDHEKLNTLIEKFIARRQS